MIVARTYTADGVTEHDPRDISTLRAAERSLLWVDVVDPSPDDLRCLVEQFSLHPLAVEDIAKHQQRAKLELFPAHAFLVVKSAELQEVDVLWAERWILTVREHEEPTGRAWDLSDATARFERVRDGAGSPAVVLYVVLDSLVDGYFAALDATEDRLEALEERIFADEPADEAEVQEHLYTLRRDLLLFRRAATPLRDIVAALMRDPSYGIDESTRVHLQDVYDHVLRATEQLDIQRELMANAVEGHLALMSNRMNMVMKRMTSWGAILLGSTLVAGIYGMNFDHMPELGWAFGYPFALALMALVTITGWWYFRRKDWL